MKNFTILLVLLIAAVVIVGCSQTLKNPDTNGGNPVQANPQTNPASGNPSGNTTTGSLSGGSVKELNIEAYKFGFRVLNNVQINKGDTVKLTVTSTDGTHGFAMPDFNVDLSPIAQGESKSTTFVADRSGTFTYFCNVPCGPGHSSMRGELVVT